MPSLLHLLSPSHFLPQAYSFIVNNPLYLFSIFGAGLIFVKIFSFIHTGIISFQPSKDLPTRYGKGSWALVTGGTEGIGHAFANELASKGFNIILLSHNHKKLEETQRELQTHYPQIQVRTIEADLTKAYEDGFAERIYQKAGNLDTSVLVNNAGTFINKPYLKASFEEIRDLVIMNALSHALITRAFLPQLTTRSQKSAIINVSSLSSLHPIPHQQVYAASKTFIDYLSRGLVHEHPNLDILSLKPELVDTKLAKDMPKDFMTAVPEQVAKAALSRLGKTDETHGYWLHRYQGWVMRNLPGFLQHAAVEAEGKGKGKNKE